MQYSVNDHRSLPLLYHLNSEPWLNQDNYAQAYGVQYKELGDAGSARPLPPPDQGSVLLSHLSGRQSCRNFASTQISLETVGHILGGAYAPLRRYVLPTGLEIDGRGVPSAGGLFPLELYPLVHNVGGLEDGLYHYNSIAHQMEPLQLGIGVADLAGPLLAQPFLEGANLVIFVAAVFERTLGKYGPRGYRYLLLEAGHVGQSICLLAREADLESLCVGGFMDVELNAFLGFDSLEESVVYCLGVGHGHAKSGSELQPLPPIRPAAAPA